MMDYRKFYNLEQYLFMDVAQRFKSEGSISAFDFFCIVIWKANRAKSKIAKKLLDKGYDTLPLAVEALTQEIAKTKNAKEKLRVLIEGWKFRLPMASAILTVLDEDNFTVYDTRVCEQLGGYHKAHDRKFEVLWTEYTEYLSAVRLAKPSELSLREKDRWLWGKSFSDQLEKDVDGKFEGPHKIGLDKT